MKGNGDKGHLLTSCNEGSNVCIDSNIIKNSKCEKLLGVKTDQNLNFNGHINEICKKAGQKLSALSRIIPYMDIPKRCLLPNTFFMFQFS